MIAQALPVFDVKFTFSFTKEREKRAFNVMGNIGVITLSKILPDNKPLQSIYVENKFFLWGGGCACVSGG